MRTFSLAIFPSDIDNPHRDKIRARMCQAAQCSGRSLQKSQSQICRGASKVFLPFDRLSHKPLQRENPDDQAYVLAQAVLEADRADTTSITAQLRAARMELDKVHREKRLTAAPQRPTVYAPASYPYTPQYRHYTYPYAQYQPSYHQVYSSYPTPTNSQPVTPVTQFQSPTTQADPNVVTKAIPVQLPVSSLPALHALGIMPVPATALPPPDQPQPQAVLKGTTSNGTMLSLEINLNLLQTAQTSGLAMILNSLTSAATASGR